MPRVVTSLAVGRQAKGKENMAPLASTRAGASSSSSVRRRHEEEEQAPQKIHSYANKSSSSSANTQRVPPASRPRKRRSDDPQSADEADERSLDARHDESSGSSRRRHEQVQRDPPRGSHDTEYSKGSHKSPKLRNGSGSSSSRHGARAVRADSEKASEQGERNGWNARELQSALQKERDEVQMQFDDLRELRFTEPERLLKEWKQTAEEHNRTTDQYIATLKRQIESLESKNKMLPRNAKGDEEDVLALRQSLHESRERESGLREEVSRLQRQVKEQDDAPREVQESAVTSRLAMQARVGSGVLGAGDERAVRRLYEDLTGLVVNKVESASVERSDRGDRDAPRRFHAIFACGGYHDLEIKLEESTSSLPSASGTSLHRRQDFVYTPVFDKERDAELLESGRLPDYLRESIRFERAAAVKFLNTLHKRLDRHSKRS